MELTVNVSVPMALDNDSYTFPHNPSKDDEDSKDKALGVIHHARPARYTCGELNNEAPPVVMADTVTIPTVVAQPDTPLTAIVTAAQNPPGGGAGRAIGHRYGGWGGWGSGGGGSGRYHCWGGRPSC